MGVRSDLVAKTVVGLALAALLLGGLADAAGVFTDSGCTPAEEDLIPALEAQKVLDVRPGGAVPQGSSPGCFDDDPFPSVGRSYRFSGTSEEYISFYDTAARNDGWRPVEVASGDPCYTKRIGDFTAFFSMTPALASGLGDAMEYDVGIAAVHGEAPESAEFLC